MNPFAPFADRDFRLYFTGEVFSTAGSGLHIVAFGWYLLERTGSATSVALVWAIGLGAGIVVLPLAGPLADRYPRRMLAIAADLARLVLVGGMAALAYAGSPSIPVLYVLTFLVGIGHSIFFPSITALLQEVIRPGQLAAASGLVEVTWQAGNLTGAALGGPILVRFGLGTAFAIDAATYAISALALLALHHRPAPAEGPHESALAMARAGFAYLRRHPALAGFGIASVIPWVATISLNVVIVAYVLQVLHLGATAYGLSDMTYGVGAMASGVFAALLVLRVGEWRAMTGVMVALIACYAALAGVPADVVVFYAVLFLAGFCSSAFRVITSAYLFKVVPNEVMGRTSSTFLLASMLLQVIVTLSIGPLVNHTGSRGGFVVLAAIVAAGLVLLTAVSGRCGGCRMPPPRAASKPGREPRQCAPGQTRDGLLTHAYPTSAPAVVDRAAGRSRRGGRRMRIEQRRLAGPHLDPCAPAPDGMPRRGSAGRAVSRHGRVLRE